MLTTENTYETTPFTGQLVNADVAEKVSKFFKHHPTWNQVEQMLEDKFEININIIPDKNSCGRIKLRKYYVELYLNGNGKLLTKQLKDGNHFVYYSYHENALVAGIKMAIGLIEKNNYSSLFD